jgi:acyl-CoA synthetase (AMP-forming)/AMP-acid ligase II
VDQFLAGEGAPCAPVRLVTDRLPDDSARRWQPPPADSGAVAFLQYTSGSTASPKGVTITHGNLMVNVRMIRQAFDLSEAPVGVGWLPLFHDMGLVGNVLGTAYVGGHLVLMPPAAFLQRPARWLEAVARYRATVSGGPDFAYDLCARKVTPAERAGLDLSGWAVAFTGAEPVRPETLDRFTSAFGTCGFRRKAFFPCYGLAEATLLVTAGPAASGPRVLAVSRRALEQDRVSEAGAEARSVVSCGGPAEGGRVAIVDPSTSTPCPTGRVGEVWVGGSHVAAGYWEKPAETEVTLRAHLADTGEGPFLRTGDLGFLRDGELFVTGRLKDLIIIRGANHYPEDLEVTAGRSHPALRPQGGAAFAVEAAGEVRVVVAHEVERGAERSDLGPVLRAVRRTVTEEHDVAVHAVLLLRAGAIPRTSSGKVRRHACAAAFAAGELDVLATSALGEDERTDPPTSPADGLEQWLAGLWAEVLGVDVGAEDNFFDLGGNSVQAAMLSNRVQQKLGAIVPLTAVFEAPTVVQFAGYLRHNYSTAAGSLPGRLRSRTPIDEEAVARFRRSLRPLSPSPPDGSAAKNPQAVFVLAPPRSGSTLLRVLLAGHPRLFAPPELELLPFHTMADRRAIFSGRHEFWLEGALRAVMEAKGCDARTARQIVRGHEDSNTTVRDFYGLLQQWIGDRTLVDKTPSYALRSEVLVRAEQDFEEPLYIHLTRHPAAVVQSFEEVKLHLVADIQFASVPEAPPRELAELTWLVSHENILQHFERVPGHRRLVVSFERLVADPRGTVKGICRFLGLEFVPDMLHPYREQGRRMTDGVGGLAPMVGDPKFHTHKTIDAAVADRWRSDFDQEDLGRRTLEMAEHLGYSQSPTSRRRDGLPTGDFAAARHAAEPALARPAP